MIFGVPFIACVTVGFVAQKWKLRTGVLWFILSAVVNFLLLFALFTWQSSFSDSHELAVLATSSIVSALATLILMWTIIATLPINKKLEKISNAELQKSEAERKKLELKLREMELEKRERSLDLRQRESVRESSPKKPKQRGLPPAHRR